MRLSKAKFVLVKNTHTSRQKMQMKQNRNQNLRVGIIIEVSHSMHYTSLCCRCVNALATFNISKVISGTVSVYLSTLLISKSQSLKQFTSTKCIFFFANTMISLSVWTIRSRQTVLTYKLNRVLNRAFTVASLVT